MVLCWLDEDVCWGRGRMILRRIAPLFLLLTDALAAEMIRKLRCDAENLVSG